MKKTVLILGYGVSGQAAAAHFLKKGDHVIAVDASPKKGEGVLFFQEKQFHFPEKVDCLILSPGIPWTNPLLKEAEKRGIEIIGEAELAARVLPHKEWIGITGTNGKTTVTLFMEHLLKHVGKKAVAAGNVGLPLIAEEESASEILVAEVSSFQLETMQTPVFKASTILNITPDHLDRYDSMRAYAAAKLRLFECTDGPKIVNEKTVREWPDLFAGKEVITFGFSEEADIFWNGEELFAFNEKVRALPDTYKGVKTHDIENWMAAYGLARFSGVGDEPFLEALNSFKKPSHRIELIAQFGGVDFIDDSKGTNIDATMRAVEAMKGKVVLIAGGVHKGSSYLPWKEVFQDKVRAICTIGQAAEMIEKELGSFFTVTPCTTMQEAVSAAIALAESGDSVLLSPGCSSFDMFRDYAHRGEEFQLSVKNWGKK